MRFSKRCKRVVAFMLVVMLTLAAIWNDNLVKTEKVKAEPYDDDKLYIKVYDDEKLNDEYSEYEIDSDKIEMKPDNLLKKGSDGEFDYAEILQNKDSAYQFKGWYTYDESGYTAIEKSTDKLPQSGVVYAKWEKNITLSNYDVVKDKLSVKDGTSIIASVVGEKVTVENVSVKEEYKGTYLLSYIIGGTELSRNTISGASEMNADLKLAKELAKLESAEGVIYNEEKNTMYVNSVTNLNGINVSGMEGITYKLNGEEGEERKLNTEGDKLNQLVVTDGVFESDVVEFYAVLDDDGPTLSDIKLGSKAIASGETYTYTDITNDKLTVSFRATDDTDVSNVIYTVNGTEYSAVADEENEGLYKLIIPEYNEQNQGEMSYQIRITATDKLGNHKDTEFTVKVKRDRLAPIVSANISGEPVESLKSNQNIELEVEAFDGDDGSGIENILYEINDGEENIVSDGKIVLACVAGMDATYKVAVYAKDRLGNISDTKIVDVFIDKDIPVFAEYTSKSEWLVGNTNEIELTATENQEGVANDAFSVTGEVVNAKSVKVGETYKDSEDSTKYHASYTIESLVTSDNVKFTARFQDAVGNFVTKDIPLKIDIDNPILDSVKFFKDGAEMTDLSKKINGKIKVVVNATDIGSGVASVSYKRGSETVMLESDSDGIYTKEIDTNELTDGENVFVFSVKDVAGNESEEKEVTLSIDNTAPKFQVKVSATHEKEYYAEGNYYRSLQFDFTQLNDENDIEGYYYSDKESASESERIKTDNPYIISTKDLTNGKKTFYFWAVDDAGNWSDDVEKEELNIDVSKPVIDTVKVTLDDSNIDAIDGVYYFNKSSVMISGKVSDNTGGSGIRTVQYSTSEDFLSDAGIVEMDLNENEYSMTIDLSDSEGSEKEIYIRVIDNVNNISDIKSVKLYYDNKEAGLNVIATDENDIIIENEGFTDSSIISYKITPNVDDKKVSVVNVYKDGEDTVIGTAVPVNGGEYFTYAVDTKTFVSGENYGYRFELVRFSKTTDSSVHQFTFDNKAPELKITVKTDLKKDGSKDFTDEIKNDISTDISLGMGIKSFVNWLPKFVLTYDDDTKIELYSYTYAGITEEQIKSLTYHDLEEIEDSWEPVAYNEEKSSELLMDFSSSDTYLVVYKAVDRVGHTTYAASNGFVYDNDEPVIRQTNTVSEWINAANITQSDEEADNTIFSFTANDDYSGIDTDTLQVYKQGGEPENEKVSLGDKVEVKTIDSNNVEFSVKTHDLDDGQYILYTEVLDNVANTIKLPVLVKKDIILPKVEWKSGYFNSDDGTWINKANEHLEGTNNIVVEIDDPSEDKNGIGTASGISTIKVYTDKDGVEKELPASAYTISKNESNVNTVTVTTSELQDGDYKLYFEAEDVAGNVDKIEIHIMKDTELPTCKIAAATGDTYEDVSSDWTNSPKDIVITLTSKLSGFESYQIVKKNVSTGEVEKIYEEYKTSESKISSYIGETKTFTIKADDLDEGDYLIDVTAKDRGGNTCEGEQEVRIDRTRPEFDSFIYSRDNIWTSEADRTDITSKESDTNADENIRCSGIEHIEYYVNGKTEPFDTVSFDVMTKYNHTYTIPWDDLKDGEYVIKAIMYDHAGNRTESEERTVKKDTTAPTGEIKLGSDNSWTTFFNTITFGVFKNETQTLKITTRDPFEEAVNTSASGIKETYYLKANVYDEYKAIDELPKEGWTKLDNAVSDSIEIKPNEDVIIYLKIVDNVGNTTYINSNGIVIDNLGVNTDEEGNIITSMTSYMSEESVTSKTAFDGVDSKWTSKPDDIKIILTDNLSGFDSFEVYKESLSGTKEYVFRDENGIPISYTDTEKVITSNTGEKVEFTIPGSSLDEGDYYIVVRAIDRSQNDEFVEKQEVKIDRTEPKFDEFSYIHTETNLSRNNVWTNTENKADIVSKESDTNANALIKSSGIEHIEYYVGNSKTPFYVVKFDAERMYGHDYKIAWESLPDGEYKVDAVIYDYAGNSSKATTIIVKKDTIAPTVSLDYSRHDIWTNEANRTDITSTESDATSAKVKGSGIEHIDYYINGNKEIYQTDRFTEYAKDYHHTRVIPWSALTDGNYIVKAVVYDHAGNHSEATRIVKKDTIYPTGSVTLGENTWGSFFNTISFGIFKNTTQTFSISASDPKNDGINENSKVKETYYLKTNVVYVSKESLPTTGWVKLNNEASDNINVAPNEDVIIYLRIEDNAGNVTYINSNGVVIDDRKPAGDFEKPTATIYAQPVTNEIYKNSVKVGFTVTDPDTNSVRSGLDIVRYTIINNDTGYSETIERNVLLDITGGNKGNATKAQLEAASTYSEELIVDIANFNSNNVVVRLQAADNAGNIMDPVELPLRLDNTKPIVNISYDNNTVGGYEKYFSADRVMTVTVTERNFDASATRIYISKNGVESTIIPSAGEWTHVDNRTLQANGDADTWIYRYTCNENVDYKVRVECTDAAGNACETYNYAGSAPQEFTVDKILPTITVNDRTGYSGEAVILTATITEHNFDPRDAIVLVTRKLNGTVLYSEQAYNAGWNSDGDVHTATLTFAEDGDYTFIISYKDKAGNQAAAYTSQEFTVDNVDPKLSSNISAANNNIANKGNINFEFTYTDINSSNEAGMITYTIATLAGKAVTDWVPDISAVNVGGVKGYSIKFDDLAAQSVLKDGIYTIEVTVKDKAGRTATEKHQFSVNRYGSAYSYKMGEYTETVISNRYVKEVTQDIELLVMNCDEITDYQVIVYNSLNEQTILTEDASNANDYSWKEQDGSYIFKDSSENRDAGFKLYSCKIHKNVFEKEGTYTIVVATKDEADDSLYGENATLVNNTDAADNTINVTSNLETTPADEVVFTVDKTVPEAVIIGLKNNQTYELNKDFSIYYADANEIQSIVVERTSGGKTLEKTEFSKTEISAMGMKTGEFTHIAKEYNDYQTVKVTVVDAAGNEGVAQVRVLVTSSVWVRFINNTSLLVGVVVGIVVVIGIIIFMVTKRKKVAEN